MKALERIFLYSVLAILVFYVFLVDNKVESQVAIQEEIKARRIVIVNYEGQEVVKLFTNENDSGGMSIYNKAGTGVVYIGASKYGDGGTISFDNKSGTFVAGMGANEDDNGGMSFYNKAGIPVVDINASEYGGVIGMKNKAGTSVVYIGANKKDSGAVVVSNKQGEEIGSLP